MARTPVEPRILIPRYIKGRIFKACGEKCCHCGEPLEFFGDFTLEHVIPLSKGGTNDQRNLVSLCKKCNLEKSNDIIPPLEYFHYLPEAKKQDLQALFDEYVRSQDWLDYDNLFMTDWFDLKAEQAILPPKRNQLLYIPMHLQVKRIRSDRAAMLINDYKQYLSEADTAIMIREDEEPSDPYYEVTWKEQRFLFFTAYIAEATESSYAGKWKHILHLDYYLNPEIPYRTVTGAPTVYCVLNAILSKIQETLLNGSQGTAILTRLRTPHTSPHCEDLGRFYDCIYKNGCETYDVGVNTEFEDSRIRIIEFIMFQGGNRSARQIAEQCGATDFGTLKEKADAEALQKTIAERLEKSVRFGPKRPLEPPKA